MSNINDRITRLSDLELVRMISSSDDYTPQAIEAAHAELRERGGEEIVTERVRGAIERERLLAAFTTDLRRALADGKESAAMVEELAARGIEREALLGIVAETESAIAKEKESVKDTPRSMTMAFLGALLSTTLGAISSSFLFFGREKIFVIHGLALMAMCYGLVRWFSGGKRTPWVILLAVVSMILSLMIGGLLHDHGLFTPDPLPAVRQSL